jgi:hypothetical protein
MGLDACFAAHEVGQQGDWSLHFDWTTTSRVVALSSTIALFIVRLLT